MSEEKDFKFVVTKNVKFYINDLGGRSEPAVSDKISLLVKKIIDDAFYRAKSNGRNTIMLKDL